MNIIAQSKENFSKYELFKLTKSKAISSMKHCENKQIVKVDSYIIYIDEDKDGNSITLLAVLNGLTDEVYASQSQSFINAFREMLDFVEPGEPFYIRVLHGRSKAGRDFINCDMVSPDTAERELGINPFN